MIIGFIIGLFLGALIGVTLMAVMAAGRDDE